MGKNTDAGRRRMTWGQCGEALGHLQDSLFHDRDYWAWGNMKQRPMPASRTYRPRP